MILPIDDTAPVSEEAGNEKVCGAGGGDAGRAAAGAAAGAPVRAAFRMSSARISPFEPDPRSPEMSTPCSRARRRAFGEIFAPATDMGAAGASATAATAAAAGAESILRPVICGPLALA